MLKKVIPAVIISFILGPFCQSQTLGFFINKGLENSPLLKDFRKQVLTGRLDSLLTIATYKPQISQVSKVMYAPVSKKFGYDEAITDGGNYTAVISLEQSLLTKKVRAGQLHTIDLIKQALEADSKITTIDLKQGISGQYLSAYADYIQIQFNQKVLNLLKEEQSVIKSLVEKGIYMQTDLLNLSLSITAQEVAIKEANIQFRNSLAVLCLICGITENTSGLLEKPEIELKNSFNINGSPEMMKFRIDSLRILNSKQLTDLNYRPKLSAFADIGFMAIRPENISHNFGTSIGLNFTLPIYDGRQRKLELEKITLSEATRLDYMSFYSSQYHKQVNQLTEQLKLTEELITTIIAQVTEQEKLISLYKIEIEKGLVRFLDFLSVVNNYKQTQNSLTVSEINRLQIINQMNYLK